MPHSSRHHRTVKGINSLSDGRDQIYVVWNIARSLTMIEGVDSYEVIAPMNDKDEVVSTTIEERNWHQWELAEGKLNGL
jgi:hypothetical protein